MRTSEKITADLARMNAAQLVLRFGCPAEIGADVVSGLVTRMLSEDPALSVELRVGTGSQMLSLMERGQLDCILTDKQSAPSTIGTVAMAKVRFQAYGAPETSEKTYGLSIKRILRETLLLGEEGTEDRQVLGSLLEKRGLCFDDFHAIQSVTSPAAQQAMAAAGRGIVFTYEPAARQALETHRLQQLYIPDLSEERPLVFLYRKDNLSLESVKAFFDRFKAVWNEQNTQAQ